MNDPRRIPHLSSIQVNRATRRGPAAIVAIRRSAFLRCTALLALVGMLHVTLPPLHQIGAQPFRSFEQHSRNDVERFVDRASRLDDVDAWNNYVLTGVAQERIQWEEEAYDALRDELVAAADEETDPAEREALEAALDAQYAAAQIAWESDATEYFLSERGRYRGKQAALEIEPVSEEDYAALIAEVEAQTATQVQLDLNGWDALVDSGKAPLVQGFKDQLDGGLDAARSAFQGDAVERAAFEAELDARAAEIRQEFEFRDRFFLLRSRNDYVAHLRSDDVSARLLADSASADAIAEQVLSETSAELNAQTADMLGAAEDQIGDLSSSDAPDVSAISDLAGDWEKQVESVISAGLRRWDEAEEELYRERLRWQSEAERSRAEGEKIWRANHEKLEAAREKWLGEVRQQIAAGRSLWEEKFAEFAAGRVQAEAELERFIQEERARRTASMDRLGEMVRGGGGALLEAKDAYFYYESLLNELNPRGANCDGGGDYDTQLYCFYREQRDLTRDSIARFQAILGESEVALSDLMHSESGDTGFLNDRRAYAGTLPADVAALDTANFEAELRQHMLSQSEDYVLYQRDVESLIERNVVFTERTRTLEVSGGLDYTAADDLEALRELVQGLGLKYDAHRLELLSIVDAEREGLDEPARLAAVKSDIADWFVDSGQRDARLRAQVLQYFRGGLDGYYLTENENDPYLMTGAEFEWERLRRERNYLAKRFETAEAVKRYADLAAEHEAGLELAQITAERADIAQVRRDVRELYYLLLKGDIELDPLVATQPAVRDSEFERILSERGIDSDFLAERESYLTTETGILSDLIGLSTPAAGDIDSAIQLIDTFLAQSVAPEERETHRMNASREKLLAFRQALDSGQNAAIVANRWQTLQSGFEVLYGELVALTEDYDFDGFRSELSALRDAFADPTLVGRREDMYLLREQIQANATQLAAARSRLDEARGAYSRARKDFDILRAGNAEELIRENLLDTTKELAAVLNRMSAIEDLPGFDPDRPHDLVSVQRADYLRAVSDRRAAETDLERSSALLTYVRGLEEAKTRLVALEDLLVTGDLTALEPEVLADLFLNAEADLIVRNAAESELQSYERTVQIFDGLRAARDDYESAVDLLAAAPGEGKTPAEIEVLRAAVARNAENIRYLSGLLITNVRGEENVRAEIVRALLDPDSGLSAEEVATEQQAGLKQWNDRALSLARSAANDIVDFLESHREADFAQLLAVANAEVEAAGGALRTDGGALALLAGADRAAMRSAMVRDWLLENRQSLEYASAAPTTADPRSGAEKWDALLDFARSLADDSDFFADFAEQIPDDADDAWVEDFHAEREALLADLDAVLASASGVALVAAYENLSVAKRDRLARYVIVSPDALRSDLASIRAAIQSDLENLPTAFREIYLREAGHDARRETARVARELSRRGATLQALFSEREKLGGDLTELDTAIAAESDPVARERLIQHRDAIQARIESLAPRISALESEVLDLEAAYREATNRLREIQEPGSSSPLVAMALGMLGAESEGLNLLGRLQEKPELPAVTQSTAESLADRLKTIVGFYETDAAGGIVRDGGGTPRVSAEFQALGITDPAVDLEIVLAGNQRGDHLERWSRRLVDWMENPRNATTGEPELLSAVGLLADALQEYSNAVAYIEHRDSDSLTLTAEAKAEKERAAALLAKLHRFQTFEQALREAVEQARLTPDGDPVTAALAVLERPENLVVFQLFAGIGLDGEPDGLTDPALQERADRLLRLGAGLRESRRNQHLHAVVNHYASWLEAYINEAASVVDPSMISAPSRNEFLETHSELNAEPVLAEIQALPADEDFRQNLSAWFAEAPVRSMLYRDAVLTALTENPGTGSILKDAVIARVSALQDELQATLDFYLEEMEFVAMRDAQIDVDESVSAKLEDLLIANGLDPAELERLASELYERELLGALQTAGVAEDYNPTDYPAELREFVLVQQFSSARQRYDAYQNGLASDIEAEREAAILDMRGIGGDFARYFLAQDLAGYISAAPDHSILAFVDAAHAQGDRAFLDDYVNRYLRERNLEPSLLPENGRLLYERVALHEYVRLYGEGNDAGGAHNLDESAYLADFADYIQLAMIGDYLDRNAVALIGSTAAERRAEFRVHFEEALGDANYERDGQSLRLRLLAREKIDRLFELSFFRFESGLELADFLPAEVADSDPDDSIPAPEDLLPDQLLAVADYATRDYRAMAAEIDPAYGNALALLEAGSALRPGDIRAPFTVGDSELDAIIERAGYAGALDAHARTAVLSALRAQIAGEFFAATGATDATSALAILRRDRVARALVDDEDTAQEMQTFLTAASSIVELEALGDAVIEGTDPSLRAAVVDRRNAVMRALVESLYVARGAAATLSLPSAALLVNAPGLGAELANAISGMPGPLVDAVLRDRELIDRFFTIAQESDEERAYIEQLFADPSLAFPATRLDLRHENDKARRLAQQEYDRRSAALLATVADSQAVQRARVRKWSEELASAEALARFAQLRGDDPNLSRFVNYRTYIGSEASYQEAEYQEYLEGDPQPADPDTFDEFHNGLVLQGASLGVDPRSLFNENWQEQLRSDEPGAIDRTVDLDDDDPQNDIQIVTIRSVSSEGDRIAAGNSGAQLEYMYHENLANNYLEAVSRLNAAFVGVFQAAAVAGSRGETHSLLAFREQVEADYDVEAVAGENDITVLENLVQDATARRAAISDQLLQQKRDSIAGILAQFAAAEQEYADSARRKHVARMGQAQFIDDVYGPIAQELENAEAEMAALTQIGSDLQTQFEAANVRYVADLNELSDRYQKYSEASDEFERRQAVREFAETPYLIAAIDPDNAADDQRSADGFSADAREEYRLALEALNAAQVRLDEASLNVRTEARLEDLQAIVAGLDGGATYAPLSDAERDELYELRDRLYSEGAVLTAVEAERLNTLHLRETHATYGDVLAARADHLRHSLRMIRVHKAREILDAEIERRRAVAEERRRAFEQELGNSFGFFEDDGQVKARNGVYLRLAGMYEGGQRNFFNEFRGWYYLTKNKLPDGEPGKQDSPRDELATARSLGLSIPGLDRAMIRTWSGAGGRLAEFALFVGSYFPYLGKLGEKDIAYQELLVTRTIFYPIMGAGFQQMSVGAALMASWFGAAAGAAIYAVGLSMVIASQYQINMKEAVLRGKRREAADLLANSRDVSGADSVVRVLKKQALYEEALADLEYFTKSPDLQTSKERIIEWGRQHADSKAMGTDDAGDDLYRITDEDLLYLFDSLDEDSGARFRDSSGTTLDLTAEQENEALDVANLREDVEFRDAFGRRYDPARMQYTAPGPLQAGTYRSGGEEFIRVKVTQHNGTWRFGYAPLIADDVPQTSVFDLGKILNLTAEHGNGLRDLRRDLYLTTGEAAVESGGADRSLVLKDRDSVFGLLFNEAGERTDGGREFSGYRQVYAEYENNEREVLERELAQRRALQTQEWDLREQELNQRYERWERKMDTLLASGTDRWGGVTDNYLQEWRQWEREHDAKVERGKEIWDEKIRTHITERQEWETDIRRVAAEKTAESVLTRAVLELNTQIRTVEQSVEMDFQEIHVTSAINSVIDEIRRSQPTQTEELQQINAGISAFQTRLELSIATGANTGATIQQVSGQFREQARVHQQQMKTLANVKIFEQYRRMIRMFAEQLEVQNRQIAENTKSTALGAGFRQEGDLFIKTAGISGAQGSVNPYHWFDTEGVIRRELDRNGFTPLEGDDLFDFLENRSNFEVDLYFETQQLATRTVFDRIIGKKPEEKSKSRDPEVVGLFGAWVGVGEIDVDESKFKIERSDFDDGFVGMIKYAQAKQKADRELAAAKTGYGELGSGGRRPGGAPLGFYPQLQQVSEDLAEKDQEHLSGLGGPMALQVVTGIFNSLNPTMWLANAAQNVAVATINGKKLKDVLWANTLNVLKQIGVVVGSALSAMTGAGAAVAVGLLLTTVSNMIQVNPMTGETGFGMTDQAAMSTMFSVMGAAVGPAVSALQGTAGTIASTVQSFSTSFLQSGMQYDEDGNLRGFSARAGLFGGAVGLANVATTNRFGGSLAADAGFGARLVSGYQNMAVSNATAMTAELLKYEFGGEWGRENAHIDMMGGDLSRAGGLIGGAVGGLVRDRGYIEYGAAWLIDRMNGDDQQQRQIDAARGIAVAEERRRRAMQSQSGQSRNQDWLDLLGDATIGENGLFTRAGNWLGDQWERAGRLVSNFSRKIGWESGANFFAGRGYRDDRTIEMTRRKLEERISRTQKPLMAFGLVSKALKNGDVLAEEARSLLHQYETTLEAREALGNASFAQAGEMQPDLLREFYKWQHVISDIPNTLFDTTPDETIVFRKSDGINKFETYIKYNINDEGIEYGIEDELNGRIIEDGALIRKNNKGVAEVVNISDLANNSIIYVNGIRTGLKDGISDMELATKYADENQDRVFLYSKAKGTFYRGDENWSPTEFARAIEAGFSGNMKFNEPSAQMLAKIVLAGKAQYVIAHSNGNNVALNALSIAGRKDKDALSRITYFGIAPNHNGKPLVTGLNKNTAFFHHTNDLALKLSAAKPTIIDTLTRGMVLSIPGVGTVSVGTNVGHPVDNLREAVKAANYGWHEREAKGVDGLGAHMVPSFSWAINKKMFR